MTSIRMIKAGLVALMLACGLTGCYDRLEFYKDGVPGDYYRQYVDAYYSRESLGYSAKDSAYVTEKVLQQGKNQMDADAVSLVCEYTPRNADNSSAPFTYVFQGHQFKSTTEVKDFYEELSKKESEFLKLKQKFESQDLNSDMPLQQWLVVVPESYSSNRLSVAFALEQPCTSQGLQTTLFHLRFQDAYKQEIQENPSLANEVKTAPPDMIAVYTNQQMSKDTYLLIAALGRTMRNWSGQFSSEEASAAQSDILLKQAQLIKGFKETDSTKVDLYLKAISSE